MFSEDFLHYVWQYKYFDISDLRTTAGDALILMYGGEAHTDSGPDFRNALIKINDTVWAGNIELHVRASDWNRHQHQQDAAYANVILHVVYDFDTPILRPDGSEIPCLALRNRVSLQLLEQYQGLQNEAHAIPCHRLLPDVTQLRKTAWLSRLTVERLEQKTTYFAQLKAVQENHWEEAFYQALARGLGGSLNADPMEQLARSLPNTVLAKNKHSLLAIEALVFGQAGVLHQADFVDDYPKQLQKEYAFLAHKYQLSPINSTAWRFSRLRPANFPTIRLAQLAALIFQSQHLWSKVTTAQSIGEVRDLLEVKVSDYWHTHYVFDKLSPKRVKSLGSSAIDLLLVNTIIPFLFLHGTLRDNEVFRDKALQWLEELSPEQNHIITAWQDLGWSAQNAAEAQGLLHLYKHYCAHKRCLQCGISPIKVR